MTTKTHIAKQEEFVTEVGIQLRADDPAEPTQDQVWLNTTENRLKAKVNNQIRVYHESHYTSSSIISSVDSVIDGNKSYAHYMDLLGPQNFVFQNFFDGVAVKVLLKNEQPSSFRSIAVTLPPASAMTPGNYWKIKSASNNDNFHVWYDFNNSGQNEPVIAGSTPIRVAVTAGVKESTDVVVKSPMNNSEAGMFEFLKIYDGNNNEYYVWWNIDGFGGNPFPGSQNGIMVNAAKTSTDLQIATLTAQAINNSGFGFTATASGATVNILNTVIGDATSAVYGRSSGSGTNMVSTVTVVADGAAPQSADTVAQLTATAIDALGAFVATSSGPTVTINYSQYGYSDNPENENIPSGFSFLVLAPGSGPVKITWPEETKFDQYVPNTHIVNTNSWRLYEFVKIGPVVIGTFKQY